MADSAKKALASILEVTNMGANTTQAIAIVIMLFGFVLLAGAFAGGGIILAVGALALLGVSAYFFLKCKNWEHQE